MPSRYNIIVVASSEGRADRGHLVYRVRCSFGSYLYPFEMSLFLE
jgi:hypothetical protein